MRHQFYSSAIIALALIAGTVSAQERLLFGGPNHDVFIGCAQCGEVSLDSICNELGKGSAFNSDSLWNPFGRFGNSFSQESPWNTFSQSNAVPVIVDRSGKFYGYFTINPMRTDAFPGASSMAKAYDAFNGNLDAMRKFVCMQ